MLKSFSSGLILINTQLSSFSNAFCFSISLLIFLLVCLIHQLQLQAYIYENKDQSCSLMHYLEFVYFLLQTYLLLNFFIVCSLVLITSCNLNPKFFLRLHDLSVLQSVIIVNDKSLCKNLLFDCFIGLSTTSYLRFLYILLY